VKFLTLVQMITHNVNVVRVICDHLLGENHTHHHRMAAGGMLMLGGVYIAKSLGHSQFFAIQMTADLFGYLLHGIGAVPYVDSLITMVKNQTSQEVAS